MAAAVPERKALKSWAVVWRPHVSRLHTISAKACADRAGIGMSGAMRGVLIVKIGCCAPHETLHQRSCGTEPPHQTGHAKRTITEVESSTVH